ncbi:hypothetical protein [Nocardioides litoris]|uniref:hypothetical protein n=1 Tax=Nocardioides litoris TaxID=1926648 RepID=UPI0011245984|nr:hypothetical protein [Nocardioides litoris]
MASGPTFERVGRGLYVPAGRARTPEQRAVDAAARLAGDGSHGHVTGWASLRWRGAAYFDGLDSAGQHEVPVQVTFPGHRNCRAWDGVVVSRRSIGPEEAEVVDGLPCTTVARSLFDEVVRRDELWSGVQAVCMAAAAGLISTWLFARYAGECHSRLGAPLVREVVSLSADEFLSPREPWLWLVWQLVAGLEPPLVNHPVYTPDGSLLGVPDLFDPVLGLAAEYDGEIHRGRARHRRDVVRAERFRDHGVHLVQVVAGDTRREAASRILQVRGRAVAASGRAARWTVERPAWDPAPETLDSYLERTGQAERLAVW